MGLFDVLSKVRAQQELMNSKDKKRKEAEMKAARKRMAERAKKQKKTGGFADVFKDRGEE